jgi:hypothetical protein
MMLDLYDLWQKAIRPDDLNTGDLINEDDFFPALDKICRFYEDSILLPNKSVTEMTEYIRQNIDPMAMFFTGRSFCKGLAVMVKQNACKSAWRGLIDNYFCKSDQSLFMFDEIERQVVKSSLSCGSVILNLEQEVRFF